MDSPEPLDRLRALDPLNAEWVTLLLLMIFAVLAYTNVNSPRKWRLLAQGMFRLRLGRQALREAVDLQDRTFIGLLLVALIVIALFLWQSAALLGPIGVPGFHWFLLGISLMLLTQGVFLRTIAHLSQTDRGISEYLSSGLLLFILTGAALLPVVALIAYRSPWRHTLLVIGAALLLTLLLYRWLRGAWVGLSEGVPLRFIIIYLCAAEIVPILLLLHVWRSMFPATSQT